MTRPRHKEDRMAILAVLAASAREAEELLAQEQDLSDESTQEADRRLRQFMKIARVMAR